MATDGTAFRYKPTPPARKCKLTRLKDVRTHLARTYRRLNDGQIDADFAKALVYVLNSLSAVIREVDTEKRIDYLEAKLKDRHLQSERSLNEAPKALPAAQSSEGEGQS